MKPIIKLAAIAATLPFLNAANAAQCARILDKSINEFIIQASNNFINCVVPVGIESAAKLTVTAVGIDGTNHAIRVMGINQDGTTSFTSQSSMGEVTTITTEPAKRTVGISVSPDSSQESDKKLTVIYNYQAETSTAIVTITISKTSARDAPRAKQP